MKFGVRLFEDRFRWKFSNGKKLFFWKDNWLGFVSLKYMFTRLFSLSILKDAINSLCEGLG